MQKILISIMLLAVSATATYIPGSAQQQKDASQQQKDCIVDNWNVNCFLIRSIISVQKMQQMKDFEIADGVTFMQEKPVEVSGRQMSEKDILSQLPQNSLEGTMKLTNILYDAGTSLMNSHSLKFDMSVDHPVEEARTKLKKNYIIPLIVLLIIKIFLLMPMIGLSLVSFKAIFFSKLALLAGIVMGFQKFFNSNDSASGSSFNNPQYWDGTAMPVWIPDNSDQINVQNKRNMYNYANANDNYDAHNLAYVNYARSHNNAN